MKWKRYLVLNIYVIKAVDDDCEDSDSLFGIDGQKSLEEFIYKYLN